MVLEMVEAQTLVAHCRKKKASDKANHMIQPPNSADRAVHGIMRSDEKTCRQIALNRQMNIADWRRGCERRVEQKINEMKKPKQNDEKSN